MELRLNPRTLGWEKPTAETKADRPPRYETLTGRDTPEGRQRPVSRPTPFRPVEPAATVKSQRIPQAPEPQCPKPKGWELTGQAKPLFNLREDSLKSQGKPPFNLMENPLESQEKPAQSDDDVNPSMYLPVPSLPGEGRNKPGNNPNPPSEEVSPVEENPCG